MATAAVVRVLGIISEVSTHRLYIMNIVFLMLTLNKSFDVCMHNIYIYIYIYIY